MRGVRPRAALVGRSHFRETARASGYLVAYEEGGLANAAADARARGHADLGAAREAYCDGLVPACQRTAAAVMPLLACTRRADEACARAGCVRLAAIPWRLAILKDHVDGGFPHTHGDMICVSREFATRGCRRHPRGSIRTLIHEKIHVYQRMFPDETALALEVMGYRPLLHMRDLPPGVRALTRCNPDVDGMVYGRAGDGLVPCMQFRSHSPTSLGDAELVALRPPLLERTAAAAGPYEHPNEEMAYVLSGAISAGRPHPWLSAMRL